VPWADDAEVLAVHRRDLCEVQALGDRDYGSIDDTEGKAYVLLDEFGDARDVTLLDLGDVEAVAAEGLEEGDLCVRADAGLEQVADSPRTGDGTRSGASTMRSSARHAA
jgi:hypothetical protein